METIKDLVCGMEIEREKSGCTFDYQGKIYHFCSRRCKEIFSKDPTSYIKSWLNMY